MEKHAVLIKEKVEEKEESPIKPPDKEEKIRDF